MSYGIYEKLNFEIAEKP